MKLRKSQLESLQNYFKTQPVLKACLFGSYVRGEADEQSDIDLLVDLDYTQKIGLKFVQMQQDLENLMQSRVDLVSSNGLSPHLKPLIDKEKRLSMRGKISDKNRKIQPGGMETNCRFT